MLPLGLASFLGFGVLLVLVGANQAELARDLGLDLARSGLLNAALALGIGIGVVGAGPLFDRRPRRPLYLAATLLVAASLLGVDRSMGFERALLHVALVGVGAGAYDTLLNAAVVERFRERSARPMSLIHAAATVGAMLGPLAIGWLDRGGGWAASFRAAGAAHLALAVCALAVRFPPPPARATDQRPGAEAGARLGRGLLPFALVAFAYVGVEASLTVFAVPYALELSPDGDARGRLAISGFWFGLLAGRLALLLRGGALEAPLLVAAGVTSGALLAAGGLASTPHVAPWLAAVGFALGIVYPLMIALAGQRFPGARGTAAGLAAGAGAVGGFAIPWLHGAIGDRAGVAAALTGLAFWCFAVAAAGRAAARTERRPRAAP